MKIAYGTYATNMMSLEDSLIMMANIGYEGYDPINSALISYNTIKNAFNLAGVN